LFHLCCTDVGAGVGRVTKHLLCPLFKEVDMLDQSAKFINSSYLGYEANVVDKYICPMQEFKFSKKYDLIWIQWVRLLLCYINFLFLFTLFVSNKFCYLGVLSNKIS